MYHKNGCDIVLGHFESAAQWFFRDSLRFVCEGKCPIVN